MSYIFRKAETPEEFEQIRRLNHLAFAEELGQHDSRADGLLVDALEHRSEFFIAVSQGHVVGMLSTHADPPYSIEKRLPDPRVLQSLIPPLLEVRLLAFHPAHRRQTALLGLFGFAFEQTRNEGYRTALISGVTLQLRLYRRLGFRDLGPAVPQGHASFVPMALDLDDVPERLRIAWHRYGRRASGTFAS